MVSYQRRFFGFQSAGSDKWKRGASVVVKFWPHPRWHVSLTVQLSELHQSSPPEFMLFPISCRSPLLWGFLRSENFSSELSSSSNNSPSISADKCATLFSSMFTWDATQCGQLWTMADFPACNPYKPAPLIAVVTTSRYVQIVQLQRFCLHHLSPCQHLNRV